MLRMPEKRTCARFPQWTVVCFCTLAAAACVTAQQTALEVAGTELTHAIVHAKQHSVAVLDFSGPGNKVTALGQQIADQLSAAIAKTGGKLQVEDRWQVADIRIQNSYAPEIVLDPGSLVVFGQDLNVESIVSGELSLANDNMLAIDLKSYRVHNGKGIIGVKVLMPMTPEMTSLMAKSAPAQFDTLVDPVDRTLQKAGYKPARCLSCPRARYTDEAMRQLVEGTVELIAVIGVDGRATNVAVLKALPGGLTAQSIDALKNWKLAPALAPDGKPMPCREIIEMRFQLR